MKSASCRRWGSMFILALTANSISCPLGLAAIILSAAWTMACRVFWRASPWRAASSLASLVMYATNSLGVPSGTAKRSAGGVDPFGAVRRGRFFACGLPGRRLIAGRRILLRRRHGPSHHQEQEHQQPTVFGKHLTLRSGMVQKRGQAPRQAAFFRAFGRSARSQSPFLNHASYLIISGVPTTIVLWFNNANQGRNELLSFRNRLQVVFSAVAGFRCAGWLGSQVLLLTFRLGPCKIRLAQSHLARSLRQARHRGLCRRLWPAFRR